jgi:hypothetical protein
MTADGSPAKRRPPKYGSTRPRLSTPTWGRASFGAGVAEAGAQLGLELLPWQAHASDRLLEYDRRTGRRRYRTALVGVARQNGKSWWLRSLVWWWLTAHATAQGEPQCIVHAANTRALAVDQWAGLVRLVEEHQPGLVEKVVRGSGRERLTLVNGSTYEPIAASDAVHGRSVDLFLVDEVWDVKPTVLDDGILPTTMARPDPLVLMASTAGDEGSVAMRAWRDRGLAAIDTGRRSGHLFLEWSADEADDPDDPHTWAKANPGLGRTIRLDALREAAANPNRPAFLRAHLNRWVTTTADTWLPAGTWGLYRGETPDQDPSRPVVHAVELNRRGGGYAVVTCTPAPSGRVHVTAAHPATESALWELLREPMTTGGAGARVLLPPLFAERAPFPWHGDHVVTVGDRELRAWATLAQQAIAAGLVSHDGGTVLADQLERCVGKLTTTGTVLTGTAGQSVHAVRALVWALVDATRLERTVPRAVVRFA